MKESMGREQSSALLSGGLAHQVHKAGGSSMGARYVTASYIHTSPKR